MSKNAQAKQQGIVTILAVSLILLDFPGWLRRDLNLRPWAYESPALTTELLSHVWQFKLPALSKYHNSGRDRQFFYRKASARCGLPQSTVSCL